MSSAIRYQPADVARESITDVWSPSDTPFESATETLSEIEEALELVADVLLDTASAVLCATLEEEESCVAFESAVLTGKETETARLSAFDT